MDRDHFDSWCMSSVRAGGKENPLRQISWVAYRYFYLATRHILDATESGLLEGATQEKAERCMLDDMYMDFDHDVTNLQG